MITESLRRLMLLLCALAWSGQGLAVTAHWSLTGTFSDLCFDPATGHHGAEVHIVMSDSAGQTAVFALVQFADGTLDVPVLTQVESADYFNFAFAVEGSWQFIGELLPDCLTGTFFLPGGGQRSVALARKESYWSAFMNCPRPAIPAIASPNAAPPNTSLQRTRYARR